MVYEFGNWYRISATGNCDGCGSPHRLDNVIGRYEGRTKNLEHFSIFPFSCPGCRKMIWNYNIPVKLFDVTQDFENIKNVV